jgi:hypothetical protein
MGWFGFGGPREREEHARYVERFDDKHRSNGSQRVYKAIRIDRAGKPSRIPDHLPRRRDREDRWDRR